VPLGGHVSIAAIALALWEAGAAIRARVAAAVEAQTRAARGGTAGTHRRGRGRRRTGPDRPRAARRRRALGERHGHAGGALRRMLPADPPTAVGVAETVERTGPESLVELRRKLGLLRGDADRVPLAPQPGPARIPDLVESTGPPACR
jgi:hypothetical protein